MRKKLIAALAAAAMLCCTSLTPAAAVETYKKGDVNMDGVVDVADAQLVLEAYCWALVGIDYSFSDEQAQLATIVGIGTEPYMTQISIPYTSTDAMIILRYATDRMGGIAPDDIMTYWQQVKEDES